MLQITNEYEMSYNFLCSKLEKDGWTKETTVIDEKMRYVISLSSAKIGETSVLVDIMCPKDEKILIRGTENGDVEKFRDGYSIRLVLKDSLFNEVAPFTKIKIEKDTILEDREKGFVSPPIRCFYTDISKGDNDHLYRPRKNILLQEGEHLFIYVIGENIGQKKLPEIEIDKDHISFNIKADIFKFKR